MAKKADASYEGWKKFHGSGSKDDFDVVKRIREEFTAASDARRTNCYWFTGRASDTSESDSPGGDWAERWEMQEKAWLNWYQPSSADDFHSNVKLPETSGRIESTMQKIRKVDMAWTTKPNDAEDIDKAKIAKLILDHEFYTSNLKESVARWAKLSVIHGSGFARFVYKKVKKKVRYAKYKNIDEKDKKDVEEGKAIYGKPVEKTVFEGFALIPVPSEEFYPDPQARVIHGVDHAARYVIWRRLMHIDDFKAEFEGNPNCMNVDKVKPISDYKDWNESYEFFQPPSDISNGKVVEVLEYENQLSDEYIVTANDILVRNTPLPYAHKELTFFKIDCIENPKQFYGIGIPDYLDNIQASAEITLNMMIDKMYRNMNTKYMVATDVAGQFSEQYQRLDNQIIAITSRDGAPLSSKVMPLPYEPFGFESFKIMDILRGYATMATQIDPSQMTLQQADKTATATAMNAELAELLINSIIENMGNTFVRIGRQMWSIIREKFSVQRMKEIVGADGTVTASMVPWSIRLEDMEVSEEDGKIKIETGTGGYNFMEIKEDYLETNDDLDIRIAPESLRVLSQGFKIQKVQEAYAQMMPNAVDPTDPAKVQMHPAPLYDARKLAQWLVETLEVDTDVLLDKGKSTKEDIEEAREHVTRILDGEKVPGSPGRSDAHKGVESQVLQLLNAHVKAKTAELQKMAAPQMDPMTGMPMPPAINPALEKELTELIEKQQALANHLATDNQPMYMTEESALSAAAPPPPPMPPQMPGMPGMGGQPPMGGDMMGMMGGGMMGGGVPMPDQMQQSDILPNFGGQL